MISIPCTELLSPAHLSILSPFYPQNAEIKISVFFTSLLPPSNRPPLGVVYFLDQEYLISPGEVRESGTSCLSI